MTAEIQELWDTGEEIINVDSIEDLRKCENVIVGAKNQYGYYEVLIDNSIVFCKMAKRRHPADGSSLYVCAIG